MNTAETLIDDVAVMLRLAEYVHRTAAIFERMGENDMGVLTYEVANKFHKTTDRLRILDLELQKVVRGLR